MGVPVTTKPAVGDVVFVPIDPDQNSGGDRAPAIVTRVEDEDGGAVINARVLQDRNTDTLPWRQALREHDPDQPFEGDVWAWRAATPAASDEPASSSAVGAAPSTSSDPSASSPSSDPGTTVGTSWPPSPS